VVRTGGITLAPGTPCFIDATVEAITTNARVIDLDLLCGARALYRTSDPLQGTTTQDSDVREQLGARDDESTFTLQYSDIGTRTGARSQLDFDSRKRTGVVFRDTSPRWRVELTVQSESAPTAPLSGLGQRLRREGRVTRVSGATIVSPGATCVLRAMPTGSVDGCVAEVRCSAVLLFPADADVRCTYDGARPIGVVSEREAPSLRVEGQMLEVRTAGTEVSRAVVFVELE
jgi:hypothetical protein